VQRRCGRAVVVRTGSRMGPPQGKRAPRLIVKWEAAGTRGTPASRLSVQSRVNRAESRHQFVADL